MATLGLPGKKDETSAAAVEVRLRCLEAAAKNPDPRHVEGMAASVLAMAEKYATWVLDGAKK